MAQSIPSSDTCAPMLEVSVAEVTASCILFSSCCPVKSCLQDTHIDLIIPQEAQSTSNLLILYAGLPKKTEKLIQNKTPFHMLACLNKTEQLIQNKTPIVVLTTYKMPSANIDLCKHCKSSLEIADNQALLCSVVISNI